MTQIVGLSFKYVNEIHYVTNFNLALKADDWVIAKTIRAKELGRVDQVTNALPAGKGEDGFVKRIVRKASDRDFKRDAANRGREVSAFQIAVKKIERLGLPMRLIKVHYLFDHSRIIFYFKAAGKVDFRQLVKDLAAVFKTRIELRQIGVRDEAKMLGGIASCGRPLCCATWIREFSPVTVRMAKDQHLSLNPNKISGVCGRLQCCLSYEQKFYEGALKGIPGLGSLIKSSEGDGKLIKVNIFNNTANLLLDDASIATIPIEELQDPERVVPRGRRSRSPEPARDRKKRGRREGGERRPRNEEAPREDRGPEEASDSRREETPGPARETREGGSHEPPRDTQPREEAPRDARPREEPPRETRPREVAPRETQPREEAPRETRPREETPRETQPREEAPRETRPREETPRETQPREEAPRETRPREETPRATQPREEAPSTRDDRGEPATRDEGRRRRKRRRGRRNRSEGSTAGNARPEGGGPHGK